MAKLCVTVTGATTAELRQKRDAVAWFENGKTVQDEKQRAPLTTPVEGSNPLERLNAEIHKRAKGQFGYTRAITYGNEGGK